MSGSDQRGQATVELALCLPLVGLLLAAVIEIGAISIDRAQLWHSAREAARVAAVTGNTEVIEEAAQRSAPGDIDVSVDPTDRFRVAGEAVTVKVTYRPEGEVPLIGMLVRGLTLDASVSMRVEEP